MKHLILCNYSDLFPLLKSLKPTSHHISTRRSAPTESVRRELTCISNITNSNLPLSHHTGKEGHPCPKAKSFNHTMCIFPSTSSRVTLFTVSLVAYPLTVKHLQIFFLKCYPQKRYKTKTCSSASLWSSSIFCPLLDKQYLVVSPLPIHFSNY